MDELDLDIKPVAEYKRAGIKCSVILMCTIVCISGYKIILIFMSDINTYEYKKPLLRLLMLISKRAPGSSLYGSDILACAYICM